MDRGAWEAAVHVVAKSQTQLSDFTTETEDIKRWQEYTELYKKDLHAQNNHALFFFFF